MRLELKFLKRKYFCIEEDIILFQNLCLLIIIEIIFSFIWLQHCFYQTNTLNVLQFLSPVKIFSEEAIFTSFKK
ncbi:hypothetical protein BpHYR1_043327 [Brachionus plicatilis]|uniref:Uncharacterized protein n=1 Tax=Brachionus plicatilis TaxID=10195 RepID=A0A3M7QHJ7_BRAPC|nr:hypothetical protein BpHYR1_043327 [Brachionus plicatilis]